MVEGGSLIGVSSPIYIGLSGDSLSLMSIITHGAPASSQSPGPSCVIKENDTDVTNTPRVEG